MLTPILLALAASPSAAFPTAASPTAGALPARPSALTSQSGFSERYAAAKNDVAALWELYEWCVTPDAGSGAEGGTPSQTEKVLRRVLRLEPDHLRAHKALGHVREDGRWFESERALERFRRVSSVEDAKAKGFVRYRREYVHPDAVARLRKGLRFDRNYGMWLGTRDRRRLGGGWRLMDEEWIHPDEAGRLDEGLWRVDGEWVALARAEAFHAKIDRRWVIPGPWVRMHTTVPRAVAKRAMVEMEDAIEDLQRLFAVEPLWPLDVMIADSEEQYDRVAVGDPQGRRAPTHAAGIYVVYSGFYAESWIERPAKGDPTFSGMGVSYWNENVEFGDLFGVHNARYALGLSYVNGIDPSPNAVERALEAAKEGEIAKDHVAAFHREKRLPMWLRYGAAVYVERFFADRDAAKDRDAWWPRTWSLDNLRTLGGLEAIETVLDMPLDPTDLELCRRLLIESGLLVAYILDGNSTTAKGAHLEFKEALASRDVERIDAAIELLERVLVAERTKILAFANLEETLEGAK